MFRSKCLGDNVFLFMVFRFIFRDHAFIDQFIDIGVIPGDLPQLSAAEQVCTAVSNVGNISRVHPYVGRHDGRGHASILLRLQAHLINLLVYVFDDIRKESNPCALCAKMRKGALNQAAKDLGCNKIAYAHHKDDLVETMLLSLIYEGRFYAFSPYTYLDRMDLSVIRPLMYVDEADVIGFKNKYELPVCKNPCPVDGHTKREYVKKLTKTLERENPGVKDRLFHAIVDGNIEGWPEILSKSTTEVIKES